MEASLSRQPSLSRSQIAAVSRVAQAAAAGGTATARCPSGRRRSRIDPRWRTAACAAAPASSVTQGGQLTGAGAFGAAAGAAAEHLPAKPIRHRDNQQPKQQQLLLQEVQRLLETGPSEETPSSVLRRSWSLLAIAAASAEKAEDAEAAAAAAKELIGRLLGLTRSLKRQTASAHKKPPTLLIPAALAAAAAAAAVDALQVLLRRVAAAALATAANSKSKVIASVHAPYGRGSEMLRELLLQQQGETGDDPAGTEAMRRFLL